MPSAGDVAKHPFPFLTSGELEAVRARRLQAGTRDGAGRRLIDGAERFLNEKDFVAVLDGAVATNLFVVQSLLLETSLAFLLTGQERFVEPVRRIVASLVDDDYRRTRLPSEVHLGFTLPALGVAAQLCHGHIDLHLVQKVAVSMGSDLATSAGVAPWGRQVPRRAAWNHTAVGFTGLGCAGLLCPDGEQGTAWTELALRPAEDLAVRYVPPEHFADPDTGYLAEHVRHGMTGPANDPTEGSPSSSYGHNVMLVGERGQRPSGRGRGVCGVIVRARRASEATVVTCDLATAYKVDDYNPVHHAVRHCVFTKRPFPYLLVVDDLARPDRPTTFRQLFHTPPAHDIRRGLGEVDFRLEFSGEVSRVLLRGLDRCTVTQRTVVLNARPWPEHALWVLERHGAGGPMASLILPYRSDDGSAPVVQGRLDARRGQVMLRWRHGADQGVDLLSFRPGRARPATLLRDGRRLLEATTVLRTGTSARLPVCPTSGACCAPRAGADVAEVT